MVAAKTERTAACIRIALLLVLLFVATADAAAERLPIKSYGTSEGLVHNRVKRIVQDSRGFLWFCTAGGLSRFDGYRFINYTVEDGLPAPSVNDLLEASDGIYWVATNSDGVIRFNLARASSDEPRFKVYTVSNEPAANRVNVLYKDPEGLLWAGTDGGLFYMDEAKGESEFRPAPLGISSRPDIQVQVWAIAEDRPGSLWIGTKFGLVHRLPDGRMVHYAIQPSESNDTVRALLVDKQKRLWLGHQSGLIAFDPEQASLSNNGRDGLPADARRYAISGKDVQALYQTSDGRIWVASYGGNLIEFDGEVFHTYLAAERAGDRQSAFAEDRDGNLWLSTESNGAMKITRHGLVNFGAGQPFSSIFENRAGELYAYSGPWRVSRFDGNSFTTVRPNLPAGVTDSSWRANSSFIEDHTGEWWVATNQGLCRFPKVNSFEQLASVRPKAVYTTRDGLAGNEVTRLFEDSRGDIWIASFVPAREVVTRWERRGASFHRYSEAEGLRPFSSVVVFCEDAAGGVWMGLRDGGLVRYRDGRFLLLGPDEGLPAGGVNSIYLDRSGRLWVAANQGGLCRIDEPEADRPQVVTYTKAEGLKTNLVQYITGDLAGRIYASSNLGIDRLDPATGLIKHYSTADGLNGGEFLAAFRDRTGTLWFGTAKGVSRLIPEPDLILAPPPVFISGLRISGERVPIFELGETAVTGLELKAQQNNMQIDFFAFAFGVGEALRYQYKLEGSNTDWSAPTDERTINYPNLAPGSYRFLVRAVNADGAVSQPPAAVAFKILPPIWQQWWFITLAALFVGAAFFAFDRYRVARLRELDVALSESHKLTEQLTKQRAELHRANRLLSLEAAVTAIISDSATLNDAAPKILQAVCELAEWDSGKLWELEPQTQALRCVAVWRREAEGESAPTTGIDKDANPSPSPRAYGFPVLLGQEVLGILELFSKQERGEEIFEMMTNIGSHIGQLIDRKRAEEALGKSREERLAELERVRRRIATDLHDDIGASLTQISILSEVAHQHVARGDKQGVEPLARIISVSNELVEAMSDIVWAINPKKDHLSDLLQRMRRFASDIFTARNIAFHFHAPSGDNNIELGANLRREIFLIFKESVNNTVKHSGCSRAEIEFQLDGDWLTLKVSDDGKGFDEAAAAAASADSPTRWRGGNGIASMRKRATEMRGEFKIVSRRGEGTTSTLKVPVNR